MTATSSPKVEGPLQSTASSERPSLEIPKTSPEELIYPSKSKTLLIMSALYITMFIIALDKTIIATAIPRITDDFHSLSSIGWYGSAYMLTLCAFQLLWGRIYTFYPSKKVFLAAVLVFEIGSIVCGAAPTSVAFIVGRTVAGLGAAGIQNGTIIVFMETVPLAKRPLYQGLMGMMFGVASVIGPLLGGVFTDKVTWRWCFYINLPFGALAVAVLILLLPARPNPAKTPLRTQLKKLDPVGTLLFLPSIVCLLVALQYGGTTYAWSSWRIIVLLVFFAILLVAWLLMQVLLPEMATLPLHVLGQRSVASSAWYSFTAQASMLSVTYIIPIFFQAIKDFTPIKSGEATLPLILALVIGSLVAGGAVQRLGYPAPFMIISSILSSVGAGLITTWPINVQSSTWIGFQFLYGFGTGLGMQQAMTTVQTALCSNDARMGVSLIFFAQNIGGAIFVSVSQTIFTTGLANQLATFPGLNLDKKEIVAIGATQIRNLVPKESLHMLLEVYRSALRKALIVALVLACLSIFGSLTVEWLSVKKGGKDAQDAKAEAVPSEKEEV